MKIKRKKTLLLLDCKAICHTTKHAYKNTPNGMIYGFFSSVLTLKEKFPNTMLIFIWDGNNLLRDDIFPEYKLKRTDDEPSEYDVICAGQMEYIRDTLLSELGFKNIFYKEGFEADDIMAALSELWPSIIVAEDQDMLQMLTDTCSIYHFVKRKLITKASFIKDKGITPDEFRAMKGIAGCTTDEVPGIVGVGEKTALQYLRGELSETSKKYKDIVNNPEIRELTSQLTSLPYPGTPVPTIVYQRFNTYRFIAFCNNYKFRGFLIRLHKFELSFIKHGV